MINLENLSEEEKEEFQTWLAAAEASSGLGVKSSFMLVGLLTDDSINEPLCALQFGYALLHDKPIILLVDKGMQIPSKLSKIADAIEIVDREKPEDMLRVNKTIQAFIKKHRK